MTRFSIKGKARSEARFGRPSWWLSIFVLAALLLPGVGLAGTYGDSGDPLLVTHLEFTSGVIIEDGQSIATKATITIKPTIGANPSHYQICENEDFSGCSWQSFPFDGMITYTLSPGAGWKNIFFRTKSIGRTGSAVNNRVYLRDGSAPVMVASQPKPSSSSSPATTPAPSATAPAPSVTKPTPSATTAPSATGYPPSSSATEYQKALEAEREKTKALEQLAAERARQEALLSKLSTPLPQGPSIPSGSSPAGSSGTFAMERRIALLIGNAAYKSIGPLKNSVNDAADMGKALKQLGFNCIVGLDATRTQMRDAVREFGDEIKKGGVGVFFYAGHGVQIDGENYLVPVDARVERKHEIEDECLKVSSVLRAMEEANNKLNIIILDACRDNPFRSFRSMDKGLATMNAPSGSLLCYATSPGSVASDGVGRNGLYTSALLKHIATPGLNVVELFMNVRNDVADHSKNKQIPWENSSLRGHFYFVSK